METQTEQKEPESKEARRERQIHEYLESIGFDKETFDCPKYDGCIQVKSNILRTVMEILDIISDESKTCGRYDSHAVCIRLIQRIKTRNLEKDFHPGKDEREGIKRLRLSGWDISDIAYIYGRSTQTVHEITRGITSQDIKAYITENKDKVRNAALA